MFYQRVRVYIKRNEISQSRLAEVAGVTEGTISKWLAGNQEIKSGAIERIAKEIPELICYALKLRCTDKSQEFLQSEEDRIKRMIAEVLKEKGIE